MGLWVDLLCIKTKLECSVVLRTEGGTFRAKGSERDRKEQHVVIRTEEVAIWGKNIAVIVVEVRHLSDIKLSSLWILSLHCRKWNINCFLTGLAPD